MFDWAQNNLTQRAGQQAAPWRHCVMTIICRADLSFAGNAEPVFELMLDPANFPRCFTGFGPISAMRAIHQKAPLAVGVERHIVNADGSVLTELITILDKPNQHAYSLSGFQPPFSWLVKRGESDWQFSKLDSGTHVRWTYKFIAANALLYPLSFLLLKFFMQRAMKRCLDNMAKYFAATEKAN